MDCRSSKALQAVENYAPRSTGRSIRYLTQLTIDTLTDDALVYVFDFYVAQASEVEAWHILVHVCRRWRNLVFAFPRRLNLRIACTNEAPVREKLDIWPPLPIVISVSGDFDPTIAADCDNIKAALEHHDRVCQITLYFDFCNLEDIDIISLLEEPFPILTDLDLCIPASSGPFDPDPSKFLGGSAQLQSLTLIDIPDIPDLLKLLLSTPNLVILRLHNSGSFLPDEMVPVLSALTRLEKLDLQVHEDHRTLENRRLPPLTVTPTALPSLTKLEVGAVTAYVEDFMARIDAPLLHRLSIDLFYPYSERDIVLDTPQLLQFISRILKLQASAEAHIGPVKTLIGFSVPPLKFMIYIFFSTQISFRTLGLKVSCMWPDWEFQRLAHFCRSAPFPLHPLKSLYIGITQFPHYYQPNHLENTRRWLEFLRPFTAVKNLYLTKELALHIAHALQELEGESVMEVLPILENVLIEEFQPSEPVHEVINEFVAARQLAGHPIIISHLDKETLRARFYNEYND